MFNKKDFKNADDYLNYADNSYLTMLRNGFLKDVLDILSKNKEFSVRNAMLIHMQKPTAKHVMSRTRWQEIGRGISTGQEPIVVYRTVYDPYSGIGNKNAKGAGIERLDSGIFQKVLMYDITQTYGGENIKHYTIKDVKNHLGAVKDALITSCKDYTYEFKDSSEMEMGTGFVDKNKKKILVRNDLDDVTMFNTLVQTTSVALSKSCEREKINCLTSLDYKMITSLEAKLVNYIITKRFEMEPVPVPNFKLEDKDGDYIKRFYLNLAFVRKIANRITNKVNQAIDFDLSLNKESEEEKGNDEKIDISKKEDGSKGEDEK